MSAKKMKVGFWIETPAESISPGEGIFRVFYFLAAYLQSRGIDIVVGGSPKAMAPIERQLGAHGVDTKKVHFTRFLMGGPFYRFCDRFGHKAHALHNRLWHDIINGRIFNFIRFYVKSAPSANYRQWPKMTANLVLRLIALLILGPLVLIAYIPLGLFLLLFEALDQRQYVLGAYLANRQHEVDVWFVSLGTWVHSLRLKGKKVVAVPDLVYVEYPMSFNVTELDSKIRSVVAESDHVVTYTEYIRQRHIQGHLSVPAQQSTAVQLPTFDLRKFFDKVPPSERREIAAKRLREFLAKRFPAEGRSRYLHDLPLDEMDYIFVSSQNRPYKNYINLVKAVEYLTREKFRPVKLVMTGYFDDQDELGTYIYDKGLHYTVLSINSIPPDVHAAFYALAKVVAIPTLFEGTFPLMIGEALSMGTPFVVSDIPQILECPPPGIPRESVFDPFDPRSIAERIEFALDHRDELSALQAPLRDSLMNLTWESVGDEFINVFKKVSGIEMGEARSN